MKEHEAQVSKEMSSLAELSPGDRVWSRISESVRNHRRHTRYVQATTLGTFLVVSAIAGIGYFLVLHKADSDSTNSPIASSTEEKDNESSVSTSTTLSLTNILEIPSRFKRQTALFQFVAEADVLTLHGLLKQSEEVQSQPHREELQEVVTLRLASIDPSDALEKIGDLKTEKRATLTRTVFQEWSLTNLEQALAHVGELDDLEGQAAFKGILDSRDDLSMDRRMDMALNLGQEDVANDMKNLTMSQGELEDPDQALLEFLAGNEDRRILRDDAEIRLFEHISRSLIRKHSARSALQRVDEVIGNSPNRGRVFNVFFDEMRKDSPEFAVELSVEMSHGEDEFVVAGVILGWAYSEPIKALESALSIREVEKRNSALQTFPLSGAAEEVPEQILETLSKYPNEGTSLIAHRAIKALARKSPDIATRHFHHLQDEAELLELAKDIVDTWSKIDATAALNWINTNTQVPNMRQRLIPIAIKELVYADSQLALQTALELETPERGIGPEASVIEELANFDVESAIGMLARSRNEKTRLSASQSIARTLLRNGSLERVIEISEELSEPSRDEYFQSLTPHWVWFDWFGLYQSLGQLPTSEIRSNAALTLLGNPGIRLSEEQEKTVETYVTEDAKSALESAKQESRYKEYVLFRN
ncbi:MAG: hypothetical protein OXG24_03070 [Gammaproteobacteria bacterium]|nr:hypothetical protein [Gammaproteobacteria bacterium]